MAADIYGRSVVPVGGVYSSDTAVMTVSGVDGSGVGALVQNVECTYTQQINQLFELGSNYAYMQLGRAQGQLTVGKILSNVDFDRALFASCTGGGTVVIQASSGCYGSAVANLRGKTLTGVYITQYGVTMTTQDLLIRENLVATFVAMQEAVSQTPEDDDELTAVA
jgi:hypothetical protein